MDVVPKDTPFLSNHESYKSVCPLAIANCKEDRYVVFKFDSLVKQLFVSTIASFVTENFYCTLDCVIFGSVDQLYMQAEIICGFTTNLSNEA